MADIGREHGDADVTIVLLLRDRVPFTLRWLAYADRIAFPFKVLVADGGSTDEVAVVLADRARFPRVDYEYVRYPYDETYSHFYAKIVDALSRVQTPLVALSDNDDFWIVDGVRESARFLRAHPDHATCGGQMAYFWVNPPGRETDDPLYGTHVRWKCSRDPDPPGGATASERLRTQYDVYYHLHRTPAQRQRFQLVRDVDPRDIVLVELLICLLTASDGPSHAVDRLFLARQADSPGSVEAAHRARHGDVFDRMFMPTWSGDVTRLVEVAAAALAERDHLAAEEARARIAGWLRTSLGRDVMTSLVEDRQVATAPVLWSLLAPAILARMPLRHAIRRIARRLYRRARWIPYYAVRGTEWRARPVAHAERDFKPIGDFLARS